MGIIDPRIQNKIKHIQAKSTSEYSLKVLAYKIIKGSIVEFTIEKVFLNKKDQIETYKELLDINIE